MSKSCIDNIRIGDSLLIRWRNTIVPLFEVNVIGIWVDQSLLVIASNNDKLFGGRSGYRGLGISYDILNSYRYFGVLNDTFIVSKIKKYK